MSAVNIIQLGSLWQARRPENLYTHLAHAFAAEGNAHELFVTAKKQLYEVMERTNKTRFKPGVFFNIGDRGHRSRVEKNTLRKIKHCRNCQDLQGVARQYCIDIERYEFSANGNTFALADAIIHAFHYKEAMVNGKCSFSAILPPFSEFQQRTFAKQPCGKGEKHHCSKQNADFETATRKHLNRVTTGSEKHVCDYGSIYTGKVKRGYATGVGSKLGANGVYADIGNRRFNGSFHGLAMVRLSDGGYKQGQFYQNNLWGLGAKFFSAGGSERGNFAANKLDGEGERTFAEGGREFGQFVQGELNGHGERIFPTGGRELGQFVQGKLNGHGKRIFAAGDWEFGQFVQGELNGHGERISAAGDWEFGQFVQGELNGHGKRISASGGRELGQFVQGKLNGHGKRIFAAGGREFGQFVQGELNGHGERISAAGDWEFGQFVQGELNGHGERISAAGGRELGQFVQGQLTGEGEKVLPDGEKRRGQFKAGLLVNGTITYGNGRTRDVLFS